MHSILNWKENIPRVISILVCWLILVTCLVYNTGYYFSCSTCLTGILVDKNGIVKWVGDIRAPCAPHKGNEVIAGILGYETLY